MRMRIAATMTVERPAATMAVERPAATMAVERPAATPTTVTQPTRNAGQHVGPRHGVAEHGTAVLVGHRRAGRAPPGLGGSKPRLDESGKGWGKGRGWGRSR
jgi:hypothetical protein